MELYKIFENTVLTEGRKENVMAKYPNLSKEIIENLSQNDPSGNNKYLEWMTGQHVKNEGREDIINAVQNYHNKLSMITKQNIIDFSNQINRDVLDTESLKNLNLVIKNPKDINSFNIPILEALNKFLNNLVTNKQEIEQMKKESDRVYEDKELLVVSPKTHKASCHYGRHSTWCVATSSTHHFSNYTKNGTLYFFLSKIDKPYNKYWSDKDDGKPPYKTALLLTDNGEASWWSKGDSNYTNGLEVGNEKLPMLTQEVVNRILAHNKSAIENRKQREIESVLISKGFYKKSGGDNNLKSNFLSFVRSNIFTPEQLVSIIRNDNWLVLYENSEVGKQLRQVLGTKIVFSLIREYLTSGDLLEIVKDMGTQEFFTSYLSKMGDEENREITSMIIQKLGKKPTATQVGSETKMYMDKWTMSESDWEKYNNTSTYFFTAKLIPVETGVGPDGETKYKKTMKFDSINKVDRFNIKDHHNLKMMRLASRYQEGSDIYAISTSKNLLDNYLETPSTEIPEAIMKLMLEKAQKIKEQ